ncbi:MAG: protein kinase [Fuerstiella sp.]
MTNDAPYLADTDVIRRPDSGWPTTVAGRSHSDNSYSTESKLTPEQQHRLTQILDDYLIALETGETPCRQELLTRHPDLADQIERHLASLEFLQGAASGGFGDAVFPGVHGEAEKRQLGDYRLIREIGRGGMGIVYEAWQLSLGRRVAVKVLPFASVLDARQIARFQNEAQAAAQVNHPGIVPVFAVGYDRGVHFYAMQLIDGDPLDAVIRHLTITPGSTAEDKSDHESDNRSTRWLSGDHGDARQELRSTPENAAENPGSFRDSRDSGQAASRRSDLLDSFRDPESRIKHIARLGIQAGSALHAAHEYGVIHRDVKPSNLLLDAAGHLWIADFGLARCASDRSLTRTGDVVGTMRYMSPEQARGDSALVDQRTDVYSLGATLYELATLHPVFEDLDGAALLHEIELGQPVPPRRLQPDLPVDLENIILKAIAPDRDERYSTALELAEDLQRFLDGLPTRACRPSWSDRASKWARRHRKTVAWSVTLLLVLTVGSAVSTLLLYQETTRTDAALAASEHNYERAQQNYRRAREILDHVGARVAEQLANVNGAEQVRHSLLQDMLTYYREFAEDSDSDSELRTDVATTYSKMAALTEHIGSLDDALVAEQRACQVLRQLVRDEPHNITHRASLAVCCNNQGLLLFRLGRTQEAESSYRHALQLQKQLQTRHPDLPRFQRDLALTWNNLGLLLNQVSRIDEAASCYEQALTIQRELAADSPDDSRLLQHLAATTANRAAMLERKDPAAARQCYADAIATMQQLLELNPDSAEFQSNLALAHNNYGAFLSSRQQPSAAVEQYQAAIELQRQLSRQAPESLSHRRDLAMSHNNLGLALSRNQQPELAEKAFRSAAAYQQELLAAEPNNVGCLGSLGGIYNNLAMSLEETQRHADAAEACRMAMTWQEAALKLAPNNPDVKEFLSRTCFNAGRMARHNNEPETAVRMALRRQELSAGNPERLLSVARELTLTSQLLPRQTTSPAGLTADDCLKLAADSLQLAINAGLTHLTEQDMLAFRDVQSDQRFATLLATVHDLSSPGSSPAPLSSN